MNVRQPRGLCAVVIAAIVLAGAPRALRAEVPDKDKQSNDVTALLPAIEQEVKMLVGKIAAGDTSGRDGLIADVLVNGKPSASPVYLDAFTNTLNRELLPLAQNPDLKVRLNAAIAAAKVANYANTGKLADSVLAFVNDKESAVVLWGMRGARAVMPSLLRPPGANPNHPLFKAVLDSVQKHASGVAAGAIVLDAYDALSLDVSDPGKRGKLSAEMLRGTIVPMQQLLAWRIGQYPKGVVPMPSADPIGTSFLTDTMVWNAQTPEQQAQSMQLMSDLLSLSAQHAARTSGVIQSEFVNNVSLTSRAIAVAAGAAGANALVDALKPLTGMPRTTPASQLPDLAKPVHAAIVATARFSKVTPPPAIDPNAATQPTTGPAAAPK